MNNSIVPELTLKTLRVISIISSEYTPKQYYNLEFLNI